MKIFYGVQGTGNGHITRARAMAKELQVAGIEVNFQFSGRPAHKYFDMEVFNGYQLRHGLTFNTNKGHVNYLKTAIQAKPIRFFKEIKTLDLSRYDLVITDFEPVTAWAARMQGVPVLGIGHQYAFNFDIPRKGADPIAAQIMKYFAPAQRSVGLHWHHFGQPILPPIIETHAQPEQVVKNKIVVYLPFEEPRQVIKLLTPFVDFQFHIYSAEPAVSQFSHITCHALSRDGFQQNLYDCEGIISNAGFELASESLQLGKKILAKPLHSQMEQISNALALQQLGYGHTMKNLDQAVVDHWLHHDHAVQVTYPNVASIIVKWIQSGMPVMDPDYIEEVWSTVEVLKVNHG
ncbi:MAG: glycosyltransferase [Methylobacter sp.]|nr:MAG: glycosyltransferase [Methylobacter sp.]PPD04148.1 MAG: glycosyltransferase [Methylobacter sp.]PPD19337.1 MAG: glycosyltransferase [Methylobacter sp.]PPD34581.1 MAG: glycosyltransferase [Methylomonas sp.]